MNWKKYFLLICLLALTLPLGAIFVLYRIAMATGLPGRGKGPQDAFRHTFSSALTSRYISPYAVTFVSYVCERNHKSPSDLMDIHNNKIGSKIGVEDGPLYETVAKKVKEGRVNAIEDDVVTWLPESLWDNSL